MAEHLTEHVSGETEKVPAQQCGPKSVGNIMAQTKCSPGGRCWGKQAEEVVGDHGAQQTSDRISEQARTRHARSPREVGACRRDEWIQMIGKSMWPPYKAPQKDIRVETHPNVKLGWMEHYGNAEEVDGQ